jgi:hypothetical protein
MALVIRGAARGLSSYFVKASSKRQNRHSRACVGTACAFA